MGAKFESKTPKKVVRIFLVFWYGFRGVFFGIWDRKLMQNGFNVGLKLLYEGIMLIFDESAYFIGPADVPEGSGPPKTFENRHFLAFETSIQRTSNKQWLGTRFWTIFWSYLDPQRGPKIDFLRALKTIGLQRLWKPLGPGRPHAAAAPGDCQTGYAYD